MEVWADCVSKYIYKLLVNLKDILVQPVGREGVGDLSSDLNGQAAYMPYGIIFDWLWHSGSTTFQKMNYYTVQSYNVLRHANKLDNELKLVPFYTSHSALYSLYSLVHGHNIWNHCEFLKGYTLQN